MLELLYSVIEENLTEEQSVMAFHDKFINGEDEEDKFFEAIRDTRFAGFREGLKAALKLIVEAH